MTSEVRMVQKRSAGDNTWLPGSPESPPKIDPGVSELSDVPAGAILTATMA